MLQTPFYDPAKSYEENWKSGPYGAFADGKKLDEQGNPQYTIFGRPIYTPFGIAAGPLLNGKFIKASLNKGFDIPMHKTVRTRVFKSHAWPNVLAVKIDGDLTPQKMQEKLVADREYKEPLNITNSFGNPSFDPDIWQPDLADAVKYAKTGQMVGASYEGTDWEDKGLDAFTADWVLGAKLLKETGVGFIEMNFSCPNKGTADLLCFDVESSRKIADAVKNEIGNTPLVVKMSYFKKETLAPFVKSLGNIVDGFSAINTLQTYIVDKNGNQALPGKGRERSGVCGPTIKWAGIDMVKRLKRLQKELDMNYTIIGVGGVTKPQDYFDYKNAGADVVMSATGAMWNPLLAQEIKKRVGVESLTNA